MTVPDRRMQFVPYLCLTFTHILQTSHASFHLILLSLGEATPAHTGSQNNVPHVHPTSKSANSTSEHTFSMGMPVHCATMLAMSWSVTRGPVPSPASCSAASPSLAPAVIAPICDLSSISRSRNDPAFSKSCAWQASRLEGISLTSWETKTN